MSTETDFLTIISMSGLFLLVAVTSLKFVLNMFREEPDVIRWKYSKRILLSIFIIPIVIIGFFGEDYEPPTRSVMVSCDRIPQTYDYNDISWDIAGQFSITKEEADPIAKKAIDGYGECLCAVSSAFDIEIDVSIGYCQGEEFIECEDKAFCGRDLKSSN